MNYHCKVDLEERRRLFQIWKDLEGDMLSSVEHDYLESPETPVLCLRKLTYGRYYLGFFPGRDLSDSTEVEDMESFMRLLKL